MASFKKHSTGWEFRLKYKDPFTGKFREKSQRGFATKKEAELAAIEFERKIATGFEQTDQRIVEYLESWLEECKKGTIRKNTYLLHQNNIKNHIAPYFKQMLLRDLKPIMYQKFLNHLVDQGYSRRTVEIVHSTMHNALHQAVILGKLEKNPCEGAIIKGEKKQREVKFIDSEVIPVFLKEAMRYGYIYWIFFRVLIETGMRKGEAAALQWSDVNLKERKITVNKTLDFSANSLEKDKLFGDPKTFRSIRTIPISQALANDLKFHAQWQNQNKLNLKDAYHHDLNLVLCREDGSPMPKSSLFNAFSRILKRCGLPPLPIHSLRHTCAVLHLEAGVDMKYVQELLGHGSIQITSDVYSHISKKLEQKNAEKFEAYTEKIFGGILGAN